MGPLPISAWCVWGVDNLDEPAATVVLEWLPQLVDTQGSISRKYRSRMGRRLLIETERTPQVLEEVLADDEAQLQEMLKTHPELLPVDELGLTGPMMVVGRETGLRSGAVDLVGVARNGALIIVEFKTGPQNSDFRHALAQLLDYGAALWGLDLAEFEASVARRYFTSPHCPLESPCRDAESVVVAAERTWGQVDAEFEATLFRQLQTGAFTYVVAAQRFTATITATIDYLNAISNAARFYAVELVRFGGQGVSALEARTVRGPQPSAPSSGGASEDQLLEAIADDAYRESVREVLQLVRGLRAQLEWGSAGVSIRIAVPDRSEPVTVAWLFPPGRSGWMGLTDLTLGFDRNSVGEDWQALPALKRYVAAAGEVEGVEPVKITWLQAWHVPPEVLTSRFEEVSAVLAGVFEEIGALT